MKINYFTKSVLAVAVVCLFSVIKVNAQINFPTLSEYSYLKGNQAATLSSAWMNPGFDDTSWATGNAPFRYGDGTGGTELTDMMNTYSTLYLRTTFDAFNTGNIQEISFTVNYDDGFVLWINGEEVFNRLAPAVRSYNSFSTDQHESGTPETVIIPANDIELAEGTNTMAIQGFNVNLPSTDFFFDISLSAVTTTPVLNDTIGIFFNQPSGFYTNTFNLTLTSPDPAATLIYTLDGSNPQNSSTGYSAGTSATININPLSTTGRGTTPAVVVRASIVKSGYLPSYPDARTYIFLNRVKTQSYPGYNWPNYDVNGQIIDYDMDPDVVNDIRYTGVMTEAFLDIPSLSIITANENLFDPATGIYVNALSHGVDWERDCSVELINPDGSQGFSVNAGLRIRGGYSRHPWYPKHAFRLFFRSEYGDSKLRFPLFGDEGVSEFDKIDIRCEQNYSWANADSRNTMLREIFSRDIQRDMDRPYTRSRYYHLYLNGMYWGLFQTQERSEARYASDYFGDKAEDYDVIKVNSDGYQVEATDGTIATWQTIYSKTTQGYVDNADYFALEGKNKHGNPVAGGRVWIDIDNLIDYMLGIFYTGNFDAPTSSFMSNKGPNNFYAIINRNDKDQGYIFLTHDAEHAMFVDAASPGIGLNENRVNIGSRTDGYKMEVSSLYSFHPQWLHYKLAFNEEYRIRFADRAALCLTGEGVLTPNRALVRLNERMSTISTAVVSESARWGDAMRSDAPFTKDDHWLPSVNQIKTTFFQYRLNILINQLRQAGLFPEIDNPEFVKDGNTLNDQEMQISSTVNIEIQNPNSTGVIYYTLNDTDPRLIGGEISSAAVEAGNEVNLSIASSAIIKARIYDNGDWSAIRQVRIFSADDDFSKLKITEIHYHPQDLIVGADTTEGSDFEFMEFKNTASSSLNLSGIVVDTSIFYQFPENTILGPGQFYVIASKPTTFYEKYGMVASGNFSGNLANSGEEILINDAQGTAIIHFTYDDHSPWPEDPDGNGPSMVSTAYNPTGDPGSASYWRTSVRIGGSPFEDDTPPGAIDEPVMGPNVEIISVYPNPTDGVLNIKFEEDVQNTPAVIGLYSLEGGLLWESSISYDTTLNLRTWNLSAGIYFLRVETGTSIDMKKIIYNP